MTEEKSKIAFMDGFSEQPRADPSFVRPEVDAIWKPSLRRMIQNYKYKIRSRALEAVYANEGPRIFSFIHFAVKPPLGTLIAKVLVMCVLLDSSICINNMCPAENQLVIPSCTGWRPFHLQIRIGYLLHVQNTGWDTQG